MPEQGAPQRLNLALQGGGSHGALTWGVLDALLEDGQFLIDGVSGTSAGAMNAVALAHGFAQAAREHKDPLEAHRAGCELARATLARLWEGVGTLGSLTWGIPLPGAGPPAMRLDTTIATIINTPPSSIGRQIACAPVAASMAGICVQAR